MNTLRRDFGTRLRILRKEAHLSQEQLASISGISVDFLSLVERGINAPSFETLEKLAVALNRPIRVFFDFENND